MTVWNGFCFVKLSEVGLFLELSRSVVLCWEKWNGIIKIVKII